jgi:type I restriction enzyme, S subunit
MQQLLTGQTRLPGFSGKLKPTYKQTELGMIPEEWEVHSIEEIADVTTGDKNTQDKTESGVYPFFVRSQIVERINSYSYDGEAVLTAGDGVGVGKVFHYANGKFDFHQRVYMIYNFRQFDGFFFYLYFSNNFYKEATKYNAKNSVDSIRRDMVTGMKIPHPSLPEQQAIATILSDMDIEITALEQKCDKIRALKQGMMQELLTGKTRVV